MAQSDLTGRSLVEDESILAFADRYRVVLSDMNGVFAVAEGDRVVRPRENSVVAVAKDDSVAGRSGHRVVAVAEGDRVARADAVRIARSGPAQADGIVAIADTDIVVCAAAEGQIVGALADLDRSVGPAAHVDGVFAITDRQRTGSGDRFVECVTGIANRDYRHRRDGAKQPVGLAVDAVSEVEGVGAPVAAPGPEVEGPKAARRIAAAVPGRDGTVSLAKMK